MNKRLAIYQFLISQILLFWFTGCSNNASCYDVYPYRPWINAERTKLRSHEHMDFYWQKTPGIIECQFLNNKRVFENLESLTLRIEDYSKEKGFWHPPIQLSPVVDLRYPWGIPNEALNDYRRYENPKVSGFHNIMTIVCVNPVVVVMVEGDIEYRTKMLAFTPPGGEIEPKPCKMYLALDRGFACGTRMPYDPNPKWFSPDLDIPLSPVKMLSENEGKIPVSWGNLILRKEDNEWAVYTEQK